MMEAVHRGIVVVHSVNRLCFVGESVLDVASLCSLLGEDVHDLAHFVGGQCVALLTE